MSNPQTQGRLGYESGRDLVIELCDRMRLARIKAGLEQEEIAELIGISSSTVSNWENGRTSVKTYHLRAWAMATGFNMSSLIPTEVPMEPVAEDPEELADGAGEVKT